MTKGILTQAELPDGTTRFASITCVRKRVSYMSTRKHVGENETRHIVVEEEAAIATSSFPLAFVTPKLVIQYAPGLSKGHLSVSSFAEIVGELLACPNLMEAHKGEFSPGFLQIIANHRLFFDHYVLRSLVFLRIPILVLIEQSEQPSPGLPEVFGRQHARDGGIGQVESLIARSAERKYFALERSDGKRFVIEPTDTGFIHWDNYKPTRIKDPDFKFKANKAYQVKPTKGGPPVNYTMRDAHMREIEANVSIDCRGPRDHPDSQPTDFSDTRDTVPPAQTTKLITPEDEANYGSELIDLAMRAAKEAMAPELNAVRQEAMSQLAAMGANDTGSMTSPQPTAKRITPGDEEDYGTELIDLAKRAANDAVAPELNALRHELRLQAATVRQSNGDFTTSPQLGASTKLLTPEDEENYGEELIDLAKRAAKDAMDPELNALKQDFLSRLAVMRGTTMATTTPSELTWTQIWNKLTTIQKIAIASVIAVVGLLFMFRYEVAPTNRMNVVIQLDRWTGITQMCFLQADRTFKCGK
jgi:hypothetical protein